MMNQDWWTQFKGSYLDKRISSCRSWALRYLICTNWIYNTPLTTHTHNKIHILLQLGNIIFSKQLPIWESAVLSIHNKKKLPEEKDIVMGPADKEVWHGIIITHLATWFSCCPSVLWCKHIRCHPLYVPLLAQCLPKSKWFPYNDVIDHFVIVW